MWCGPAGSWHRSAGCPASGMCRVGTVRSGRRCPAAGRRRTRRGTRHARWPRPIWSFGRGRTAGTRMILRRADRSRVRTIGTGRFRCPGICPAGSVLRRQINIFLINFNIEQFQFFGRLIIAKSMQTFAVSCRSSSRASGHANASGDVRTTQALQLTGFRLVAALRAMVACLVGLVVVCADSAWNCMQED